MTKQPPLPHPLHSFPQRNDCISFMLQLCVLQLASSGPKLAFHWFAKQIAWRKGPPFPWQNAAHRRALCWHCSRMKPFGDLWGWHSNRNCECGPTHVFIYYICISLAPIDMKGYQETMVLKTKDNTQKCKINLKETSCDSDEHEWYMSWHWTKHKV